MFIDIHNHFVYGVDDGARKAESMHRLLHAAAADGIGQIISTPHITPGEVPFDFDAYYAHLSEAQAYCDEQGLDLRLYPGAEVLYTPHTARYLREKRIPSLANGGYMLVEFAPSDSYDTLEEAARVIGNCGFQPVFAHCERYECLKKVKQLRELKDSMGVLLQVNGRTLLRSNGFFRNRFIHAMFNERLIDFIATDTHDMPGRGVCMKEAFKTLTEWTDSSYAGQLTYQNQLRLFP